MDVKILSKLSELNADLIKLKNRGDNQSALGYQVSSAIMDLARAGGVLSEFDRWAKEYAPDLREFAIKEFDLYRMFKNFTVPPPKPRFASKPTPIRKIKEHDEDQFFASMRKINKERVLKEGVEKIVNFTGLSNSSADDLMSVSIEDFMDKVISAEVEDIDELCLKTVGITWEQVENYENERLTINSDDWYELRKMASRKRRRDKKSSTKTVRKVYEKSIGGIVREGLTTLTASDNIVTINNPILDNPFTMTFTTIDMSDSGEGNTESKEDMI